MGFKKVIIVELDGTEKVKLKFDRKIVRPKFEFEEEFEENAWEYGVEECILPLLKEEMQKERRGLRRNDVKYLYECPYCNFKSTFFYCVDLHAAFTEECYNRSRSQPCYPINKCVHLPTGRRFIP